MGESRQMPGPESLKVGSWGAAIMLRNLGVSDVIVVGVWTNMAVEHSVRAAADHGYNVAVVSDATSSINAEWQHAALSFALTNIASITDTATAVAMIGAGIPRPV